MIFANHSLEEERPDAGSAHQVPLPVALIVTVGRGGIIPRIQASAEFAHLDGKVCWRVGKPDTTEKGFVGRVLHSVAFNELRNGEKNLEKKRFRGKSYLHDA